MSTVHSLLNHVQQFIRTAEAPKVLLQPEKVQRFDPKRIEKLIRPGYRPRVPVKFQQFERLKKRLEHKGKLRPVRQIEERKMQEKLRLMELRVHFSEDKKTTVPIRPSNTSEEIVRNEKRIKPPVHKRKLEHLPQSSAYSVIVEKSRKGQKCRPSLIENPVPRNEQDANHVKSNEDYMKKDNSCDLSGLIDFTIGPISGKIAEEGNNNALFKVTW